MVEWRDDAGDQDLARRQLDGLPKLPFVLVARIGRLERIGAGTDPQDHVDDSLSSMSWMRGPMLML